MSKTDHLIAIGGMVVSIITAIGVLIERSMRRMKRARATSCCGSIEVEGKDTDSEPQTPTTPKAIQAKKNTPFYTPPRSRTESLEGQCTRERKRSLQEDKIDAIVKEAVRRLSEVEGPPQPKSRDRVNED
jgi:hypothetical protein